jgi:hypothetical protein
VFTDVKYNTIINREANIVSENFNHGRQFLRNNLAKKAGLLLGR